MPAIAFPASSAPGRGFGEGGGRLVNAYVEAPPEAGRNQLVHRRVPGLSQFGVFGGSYTNTRGAILVGSTLYVAVDGSVLSVVNNEGAPPTVTLVGALAGTDRVIFARNNKTPTPDCVAVCDDGTFTVSSGSVASYPDGDLPSSNSVTFLDGYFVFTQAVGTFYTSSINSTAIAGTDFATAESAPDGLVRGVAFRRMLLLFGTSTTEVWLNTANATGVPFSRAEVIQRGLAGAGAVAGFEPGGPDALCFVGDDGKVYQLEGYALRPISTPDVERAIGDIGDPTTLDACVASADGHHFWHLTSSEWTWVYDLTTRQWHERASHGQANWRARVAVRAFNRWLVGGDGAVLWNYAAREPSEAGAALRFSATSKPTGSFPNRIAVPRADFDLRVGVGSETGTAAQQDPQIEIEWSDDGGVTWSGPLLRSLGRQGQWRQRVRVHRTGRTGPIGRMWRVSTADAVDIALLGGFQVMESGAP